ncbi:MAG: transposase [Planctomycetota bacterium]
MGDRRKQALRVQFDGKLRLEFHGANITSDAGLLPFREVDEAFRLTENASAVLSDPRPGKNTQHTLLGMLRQAVYGRLRVPKMSMTRIDCVSIPRCAEWWVAVRTRDKPLPRAR